MPPQHKPFKLAANCQNKMTAVYQGKIKQQAQFLNLIKATLAAPLAEHLLYCVISGKKLLLYTDAEEWATQLRHYQPAILNATSVSNLATVEFRIISVSTEQRVTRKVNLPSKKNIELIRDNLSTISDDKLKQALLRLSQTLDRLS